MIIAVVVVDIIIAVVFILEMFRSFVSPEQMIAIYLLLIYLLILLPNKK